MTYVINNHEYLLNQAKCKLLQTYISFGELIMKQEVENKKGIDMEYEMMIPLFKHGKFVDMNNKEAQQYFDWYTSQVKLRINIKKMGGTSGNAINGIGPNNKKIDIYINAAKG